MSVVQAVVLLVEPLPDGTWERSRDALEVVKKAHELDGAGSVHALPSAVAHINALYEHAAPSTKDMSLGTFAGTVVGPETHVLRQRRCMLVQRVDVRNCR